jgi:hypothetical protein
MRAGVDIERIECNAFKMVKLTLGDASSRGSRIVRD